LVIDVVFGSRYDRAYSSDTIYTAQWVHDEPDDIDVQLGYVNERPVRDTKLYVAVIDVSRFQRDGVFVNHIKYQRNNDVVVVEVVLDSACTGQRG
jgi:hypothetical protein